MAENPGPPAGLTSAPLDFGDRALESVIVAFAAWTIACHATVAAGKSAQVLGAIGTPLALALGLAWALTTVRTENPVGPNAPENRIRTLTLIIFLALATAFLVVFRPLWALLPAGLALSAGLVISFRSGSAPPGRLRAPSVTILCILLAVGATAVLNRPDADDAFYLGIANSVADRPADPVLMYDSLHGVPGLKIHQKYQRLRSFEVLEGMAGLLSGIAPITWAHLIFPLFAAAGLVLAQRRLLRHLVPDRWPWALGATLVLLLMIGDAHGWYGNLGLVRLHQGKGILVSVFVPLLISAGLEFGEQPTGRRWILLAAVQIAAIGINPTAIWLAPLLATVSLPAARSIDELSPITILKGLGSSIYPLAGGLMLISGLLPKLGRSLEGLTGTQLILQASTLVLGNGWLIPLMSFVLILAWITVPAGPGRRVLVLLPLLFLILFNPFTAHTFAEIATGARTYWRVFWLIPAPAMLAIVLSSPLAVRRWPQAMRIGLSLGALALVGLLMPKIQITSAVNHVQWAPFELRIPHPEGDVARTISQAASPSDHVLVPYEIGPWITVWPNHPSPLMVRPDYLNFGSAEEQQRRSFLSFWIAGTPSVLPDRKQFLRAFTIERPEWVCIPEKHPAHSWWIQVAEREAYRLFTRISKYEIWCRLPQEESTRAEETTEKP